MLMIVPKSQNKNIILQIGVCRKGIVIWLIRLTVKMEQEAHQTKEIEVEWDLD